VKPGSEDEFVARWHALADWTRTNARGAGWAKLLRNRDDPSHFVSFGPWPDDAAISEWRASPGFQERVGGIQELLVGFEPRVMDPAAEVE
jgi:quinol monooxygenase YgiN